MKSLINKNYERTNILLCGQILKFSGFDSNCPRQTEDLPASFRKITKRLVPTLIPALLLLISGLTFAAETNTRQPVINLWPNGAPIDGGTENVPVKLYGFIPENALEKDVPAVIACPGGGYSVLCINPEGFGIAKWLNKNGIACFVLEYRLPKGRKNVPLSDAQRAIRTVRANAAQWHVNPNMIGIIGFSAGGHLASTATTHFDPGKANAADQIERVSCRPDFSILIYPVISFVEFPHKGTCKNLLGSNPDQKDLEFFSNELQVGPKTPPTLLAHAKDDKTVHPENSALFTRQMKKFNRPVIYLELEKGGHGLSGYKGPEWDQWQSESVRWIRALENNPVK